MSDGQAPETENLEQYLDLSQLLLPETTDQITSKIMTPGGWVRSVFHDTLPKTGGFAAEATLGKWVDTAVNAGNKWVGLEITDQNRQPADGSPEANWQAFMTTVSTPVAELMVSNGLAQKSLTSEGGLKLTPTTKSLDLIRDRITAFNGIGKKTPASSPS